MDVTAALIWLAAIVVYVAGCTAIATIIGRIIDRRDSQ